MIQYFKNIDNRTVEIDKPENGIWVNLVPPFKEEEFVQLSDELDIPIEFLRDSLDIDERPRYELSDNVKFIVVKTPAESNSFNLSDAFFITIPICIILTHNHIVTVNSFDNGTIKKFLNTYQKRELDKRNLMLLKILEKVVANFMDYLKEVNQRRYTLEQKLYENQRNEDLLELVRIQKSLVYFTSALKSNELLMRKLERTNFLNLSEQELEIMNDLLVDNSQASEMATIYSDNLGSTLDAFRSIISNNQNEALKRLTTATMILTLLFFVTGIFGMYVPEGYRNRNYITVIPIVISSIIVIVAFLNFYGKKRNVKIK